MPVFVGALRGEVQKVHFWVQKVHVFWVPPPPQIDPGYEPVNSTCALQYSIKSHDSGYIF